MRVFVADFETTPFLDNVEVDYNLEPLFCCFIQIYNSNNKTEPYKEIRHYFDLKNKGKGQIKEFILKNSTLKNPSRFYFHNLKFDLAFLYDLLPNTTDYKYSIVKNGSKILQFKVFKEYEVMDKGKKRIQRKTLLDIRDSLVLFIVGIKKLGNAIGLPKLEVEYTENITDEYIEYCFRDCEILAKSLFRLLEFTEQYYDYSIKLTDIPLTLPALSKRLFHNTIQDKYGKELFNKLYLNDDSLDEKLRPFYYGGRVEVYDFNVCINGHYNDFNSHYPKIMSENEFPIPPYTSYICNDENKCWQNWNTNEFFFGAICEVIENQDIPLIATKFNDKLFFANGTKECFLFRKEIEYLLELKQKVRLKEIFHCSIFLDLFSDFIERAYSLKIKFDENTFEYLFAKILMNSLYGKFAEKKEKEHIEIIHSVKGLTENELRNTICIDDNNTFIKRDLIEHKYIKTNIIYSMLITALARLKLHQYTLKVNDAHYSDTDSIVSKTLIESSNELGKMKSEFEFSKFQPLGCKEYIIELKDFDEKGNKINLVKMKGFGKIECSDFMKFIAEYKEGKKQNRMIGFMESFARKLPFTTVLVYDKYKNSVYDKRFINSDLTTRAFDLNNDTYESLIANNTKMINMVISKYKALI